MSRCLTRIREIAAGKLGVCLIQKAKWHKSELPDRYRSLTKNEPKPQPRGLHARLERVDEMARFSKRVCNVDWLFGRRSVGHFATEHHIRKLFRAQIVLAICPLPKNAPPGVVRHFV